MKHPLTQQINFVNNSIFDYFRRIMNMKRIIVYIFLSLLCTVSAFATDNKPEVRAVWLTTNLGLDWPGQAVTPEAQRESMCRLLDKLQKANFNLVFFQVQANGDVLWKSAYEPAMADVTGNGSQPLSYDVCKFVIDECHRRGMECHAWVVPFRLGTAKQAARYKSNPVRHPYYAGVSRIVDHNGIRYLDPSDPRTRQFLMKLYGEMLKKYEFDGIQLDYTRYPGNDFDDATAFASRSDKSQSLQDWRRANLNAFVADLYELVSELRPDMIVGSAPIGSYKPLSPWKNATAYETFQQDPGTWIAEGHHDIIVPQMYWGEQSGFSAHLRAWAELAGDSCRVVVGLAPYKMLTDRNWNTDSIVSQIEKSRKMSGVDGVCFFRTEHVTGESHHAKQLYKILHDKLFRRPAPLPWNELNE